MFTKFIKNWRDDFDIMIENDKEANIIDIVRFSVVFNLSANLTALLHLPSILYLVSLVSRG